ncbi:MAG: twin-arginine translocase TatA/TatE family subunit [Actinomycetota bacterium]
MGFGNIGIGELMMILLVVMLVFGPKRLPGIARDMGKFLRDFRRETNAAIKELKEGIDIEEIKVGIFDDPDAKPGVKTPNGSPAPMPGVAAAADVNVVTPAELAADGNGSRARRSRKAPAKSKPAAGAKRKTTTPAKKRVAAASRTKTKTASAPRPARKR